MKKTVFSIMAFGLLGLAACQSPAGSALQMTHYGDTLTVLNIDHATQYLLLPVQESSRPAQVRLNTGSPEDTYMDVQLAVDAVDYYVPFALPQGVSAQVDIKNLAENAKGEKTLIYLDMKAKTLVMDRKESGLVDFSKDFPIATAAPLNLCKGETYHLNILVDMNSVEIFLDGGRIAMTNLIFPTKPYSHLSFQAGTFSNVLISPLGL